MSSTLTRSRPSTPIVRPFRLRNRFAKRTTVCKDGRPSCTGRARAASAARIGPQTMGVIHVIDREGKRHTLEALEGWRVMEIIRDWGLPMDGTCGGAVECGTCHVFVSPEWAA